MMDGLSCSKMGWDTAISMVASQTRIEKNMTRRTAWRRERWKCANVKGDGKSSAPLEPSLPSTSDRAALSHGGLSTSRNP